MLLFMHSIPNAARIALAITVATVTGCASAPPAAVREIAATHPRATYDAIATGCDWRVRSSRRPFGRDLERAWLWSRQTVGASRAQQCEVVIEAMDGGARRPVYRIVRDSAGRRAEGVPTP